MDLGFTPVIPFHQLRRFSGPSNLFALLDGYLSLLSGIIAAPQKHLFRIPHVALVSVQVATIVECVE